jgi:hypothetical protein
MGYSSELVQEGYFMGYSSGLVQEGYFMGYNRDFLFSQVD